MAAFLVMNRFLLLFLLVPSIFAGEAEIRSLIASTYNFLPRDLNHQQYEAKTKELDQVWDQVRAAGDTGLTELRQALQADGGNRYFYFDGASLLLTISKRPEDLDLAIRAIGKADFAQLDWRGYFDVVREIGYYGGDVTLIALRVLEEPKFKIFVPQHALTIDPDFAIIYMIKDVPAAVSAPQLIRAFEREKDPTRQKYILTALWYTLDGPALAYINKLKPDAFAPAVKERLVELQRRNTLVGHGGLFTPSFETLNRKRRATLDRLSDEALDEYEDLTRKVVASIKRLSQPSSNG